ncbi:MAG: hypothetical protein EBR02_01465 [Alphaproteobacteria bacterium]|nr:hypothetical protein [Alphaproteobacteria bacterium]
MKQKRLKNRLALEALVTAFFLSFLWGIIYLLADALEESLAQERNLEIEVQQIETEMRALQTKFDNTQKNMDMYREAIAKNPEDGSFISRQDIQEKFNQYKTRYMMNGLRLTMTSRKDSSDAKYKVGLMVVASSNLTLTFDTLMDENVYAMLDNVQKDFIGIPKITSVKLTRSEDVSPKVLEGIAEQGSYPLIKSEVKIELLGIKPIESAKSNANAPTP